MDNIRQERPNEGLILSTHKMHYRQSLNMIFGTHVKKSMVFKTFENKNYS